MDFVHDTLADGRPFRILTVVDNWSSQRPVREAGFRMLSETVGQVLDRILNGVSGPRSNTVDHETEFQSRALEDWTYRRGVQRGGPSCLNSLFSSLLSRQQYRPHLDGCRTSGRVRGGPPSPRVGRCAISQTLALLQRPACITGKFRMASDQLIGIEVRGIAGQVMQG